MLLNLKVFVISSFLAQFVKCVDEKIQDEILHASSYAEAYQKYLKAFETKDNNGWSGALHLSADQRKEMEEKEKGKQRRFIRSVKQCNKHNKNFQEGLSQYSQTVNIFTTMDNEEKKMYTGFPPMNTTWETTGRSTRVRRQFSELLASSLPESFSWLEKGYVTAMKNQGQCGSCWSYAATVPLEYAYKKITGNLISLSEQELLDCTPEGYGGPPDGCVGNWPHQAYNFVIATQSVPTLRSYPYKDKDLPCRSDQHPSAFNGKLKITSYNQVQSGVQGTMSAIVNHGPVAVAVYTGNDFFAYSSGIFDGCHYRQRSNHAVAIVGYDASSWMVKNSWGEEWGLKGYIKMKRYNVCNLLDYVLYISFQKVDGYVPKKDKDDESPPPPRCKDKGKEDEQMHCAYWKTLGHCQSKISFMAKFCADTCELCDYDPRSDSNSGGGGGGGGSGGDGDKKRGGGDRRSRCKSRGGRWDCRRKSRGGGRKEGRRGGRRRGGREGRKGREGRRRWKWNWA